MDKYIKIIDDPWFKFIAKIQATINQATDEFFYKQGLTKPLLPETTSAVSSPMGLGSDSTPVKINIFDVPSYLSDSAQFLLEYYCRFFPKGTFSLLPSYRGEMPDQSHLSMFFHAEAEIIGDMNDAIKLAEGYVLYLIKIILDKHKNELKEFIDDTSHIDNILKLSKFPRISLDEAEKLIPQEIATITEKSKSGKDFSFRRISRKGERLLIEKFGGIVWLTNLDHLAAPFYQAFDDDNKNSSKACDLLFGMGETIGMGERHATAEKLREAIKFHDLDEEKYEWCIKMREEYPLKTSGFGLGVERFICWLLKCDDIRKVEIISRTNKIKNIP
jgi:asparaginyl-tRNA synthetase